MRLAENVPLQNKNTYKIGGAARWYAEPDNGLEIGDAIAWALDKGTPLFVLGKGSNVLLSDSGWPGLVINLSSGYDRMEWNGADTMCESGVLLNTLAFESAQKGLSGMERLSGIPGTIGGAVIMNAGAFESCVADTIREATCFDLDSRQTTIIDRAGLGLGYRASALAGKRTVVLSARFSFEPGQSAQSLLDIRNNICARRKEKQPLEFPNCGSVFKRPSGGFAGALIEQCGLKGFRSGDAEVSVKHANFIVNLGKATARDVRRVMRNVQERVFEQTGTLLEPEVLFIGDFDEPLYVPNNRR